MLRRMLWKHSKFYHFKMCQGMNRGGQFSRPFRDIVKRYKASAVLSIICVDPNLDFPKYKIQYLDKVKIAAVSYSTSPIPKIQRST